MKTNRLVPVLVLILLVAGIFVRTWRISDNLGFGFDQGRDAKIIWNLCHNGKNFLIGPVTGIEGIFLGPFYYYFIAPFYCISSGNPVAPAAAIGVLNAVAGLLLFYTVAVTAGMGAGLLAFLFFAISFPLVLLHRWLSNPAPLAFFSVLSLLSLQRIRRGSAIWWLVLGLSLGLSLQLEAASAVFFLPATAFIIWRYKLFNRTVTPFFLSGLGLFLLTLVPQILFDFRHQHLLWHAFNRFLVTEKSFRGNLIPVLLTRLSFYYQVITGKFFDLSAAQSFLLAVIALFGWLSRRYLPKGFGIFFIWLTTPFLGLLFYQGNHGYVWDYYFTGVFPALTAVVGIILAANWVRRPWSRVITVSLVILFSVLNIGLLHSHLFRSEPEFTSLTNAVKAVDYVYEDSGITPVNVDVYVPPVVAHSYEYLLLWRGENIYKKTPDSARTPLLYLIYEHDLERPSRLTAWLTRQATIGKLQTSARFGAVTVERRFRLLP